MHYIEDIVCRHVTKNDNVLLGNFYEISHLLVNQHRRYCNAMGFKRSENWSIFFSVMSLNLVSKHCVAGGSYKPFAKKSFL